jgi:hypothetical protein
MFTGTIHADERHLDSDGWRSFTAETLLANLHRVELFSTIIYSFTALKLSLKRFFAPKRFTAFGRVHI